MKILKTFIKRVVALFPLKNVIIFESIPDLSDNTKAVFDEMVKRGLNKKYRLVWLINNKRTKIPKLKNVVGARYNTKWNRFCANFIIYRAKCIICCNRFLEKANANQKIFYLMHGLPIKKVKDYYTIPNFVDFCIAPSEGVIDRLAVEFAFDKSKIIGLGYPRNDDFNKQINIQKLLNAQGEKVIVWYPTFRQHKKGMKTAAVNAIPIIYDETKAKHLNMIAQKNNVLIIIKPHFAQDLSKITKLNLSNIRFIDDLFLSINNISSYQFVGSCDALITDYSSIYYDFTLCDKPVAAIWEDIEEYRKNPGLIEDYEFWMQGAEKIYTVEDFERFIIRVAYDNDDIKNLRSEIKTLTNYSIDGKNTERVVNFILDNVSL